MVLTIELSPEKEKALRREAARSGVSPSQYAKALLEDRLPEGEPAAADSAEGRSATFREWAASHNINNPALAEEDGRSR